LTRSGREATVDAGAFDEPLGAAPNPRPRLKWVPTRTSAASVNDGSCYLLTDLANSIYLTVWS